MSRINHINYEAFALDYLEGNLDKELVQEMESFLNLHPEIKAELEEMEMFFLAPDTSIVFENKKALERPKRRKGGIAVLILGLLLLLGVGLLGNYLQGENEVETKREILKTPKTQEEKETTQREEKIMLPQEEPKQKTTKKVVPVSPNPSNSKSIPKKKALEKTNESTIFNPSIQPVPQPFFIPKEKQTKTEEKPIAQVTNPITSPVTTPIKKEKKERVIRDIQTLLTVVAEVDFTREVFVDRSIKIVDKSALQEESLLGRMGLLPEEQSRKKITLKTIRDALVPEAFAAK